MSLYARLDLLVNNTEFVVGDASLTMAESLLRSSWVRLCDVGTELGINGYAHPNLADEDVVTLLKDISHFEVIEEACFVMCLWMTDDESGESEHVESHYKVALVRK